MGSTLVARVQQDAVDHAEDGGICADSECERKQRDESEAGGLPQHPQAVQEVFWHVGWTLHQGGQ